jgi:hypothetical protein
MASCEAERLTHEARATLRRPPLRAIAIAAAGAAFGMVGRTTVVAADDQPRTKALSEVVALMTRAHGAGRTKVARKTRAVDARPAKVGEIIVTMIKGEGKETQSRPAAAGDYVVRNRCPETGNEEYLVSADKFAGRYKRTGAPAAADGWQEFQPVGKDLRFVILQADEAPFSFVAPWGEPMVARPGDAIVQDPKDEKDVYRVARASFDCTYEVVRP